MDAAAGNALVPYLEKATNIVTLKLPGNQLSKSIQHIIKAISNKKVSIIDLSGNIIDVNSFRLNEGFFNLPLINLNLTNTKIHQYISIEELAKIVEIESLETLNLSCANSLMSTIQLTCISYSLAAAKRKNKSNLQNIILRGVFGNYADYESFFKELIHLVEQPTVEDFEIVDEMKNYTMNLLDLSDGNFNAVNDRPLNKGLSIIFRLFRSVNLSSSKINKFGSRIIAQNLLSLEGKNSVLENLCLSCNQIEGDGMKSLAQGIQKIDLKHLNIAKSKLGVAGAQALSELIKNSSLRELIICSNKIKVEGSRFLATGIEDSKTLEILDVSSNIV